jgi:hypothetical protein
MALNIELEQEYERFKAGVAEFQLYNRLGLTPQENALRTRAYKDEDRACQKPHN